MTRSERNRNSRKVFIVALTISIGAHAAALLWSGLPIRTHERAAPALALLPPPAEPIMLIPPENTAQPVTTAAAIADGGGAGTSGGASAPPAPLPATTTDRATLRPTPAERPTLAAADSARSDVVPVIQVAVTPLAVAELPEETAASSDVAQAAAPATTHIPGSAARAKQGGAGANPGSGGAGVSVGKGGITIAIGGGRKRHPPRGMPGRGRW